MMETKFVKLLLLFTLLLPLVGCVTTKTATYSDEDLLETDEAYDPIGLPVTDKLRFSDLPVPAGFKIIRDKSFVFQTEGTRVALLKYSGRAKLHDLLEFYKEQMALSNWQLLNVVEYDKSVLNFERGRQSCLVTIEPRGARKILTISVAPKAKIIKESSTRDK